MIHFSYNQVCRIAQGLERECERMKQELHRINARADAAVQQAQEAFTAARQDRERLGKELTVARNCAEKNQAALFAYENKIGLTLATLQKAEVQRDSADRAMRHAEKSRQEAERLQLPRKNDPGYQLMADGQKNALRNAENAISTANAKLREAEAGIAACEEKIKDTKPKMDVCKYNLAEISRISAEIGDDITRVDRYIKTITETLEQFSAKREELTEQLRHCAAALEQPRRMAEKAQKLLTAYRETMGKIRLG